MFNNRVQTNYKIYVLCPHCIKGSRRFRLLTVSLSCWYKSTTGTDIDKHNRHSRWPGSCITLNFLVSCSSWGIVLGYLLVLGILTLKLTPASYCTQAMLRLYRTSSHCEFLAYFFSQLSWSEVFFAISRVYNFQQLQFNQRLHYLYTVAFWQSVYTRQNHTWNAEQ